MKDVGGLIFRRRPQATSGSCMQPPTQQRWDWPERFPSHIVPPLASARGPHRIGAILADRWRRTRSSVASKRPMTVDAATRTSIAFIAVGSGRTIRYPARVRSTPVQRRRFRFGLHCTTAPIQFTCSSLWLTSSSAVRAPETTLGSPAVAASCAGWQLAQSARVRR